MNGYGDRHEMIDDARERRLQDEANARAFEEEHMAPHLTHAVGMLFRAGVQNIKKDDSTLLATDIAAVAAELAGETGDPAFFMRDAAVELERRIGGLQNLVDYVEILRAGAARA